MITPDFQVADALTVCDRNTGHDFGGRSLGAGSISVWTHHLKEMEFLPSYTIGPYSGMAVQFGAGVESWEEHNFMAEHNISVVSPGCSTVGGAGGWMSSGGHTTITSKVGLGVDQVLSLGVVTAAGRFVTADPFTNTDLFYAIRGGGGGTISLLPRLGVDKVFFFFLANKVSSYLRYSYLHHL